MPDFALKTKVPANHRITISVPADVPVGEEVEVVVRRKSVSETPEQRVKALEGIFEEIDRLEFPRRTDAEIEADLAEERASWGD